MMEKVTDSEHAGPSTPPTAIYSRSPSQETLAGEKSAAPSTKSRRDKKKLWRQACRKFNPSLVLENSGSVARDHLAAERTFLAYVRTSLGIASVGVTLVQLFSLPARLNDGNHIRAEHNRRILKVVGPLGAATIILGLVFIVIGCVRYFRMQRALVAGKFEPAHVIVYILTVLLGLLVSVAFGVIVALSVYNRH